MLSVVLFLMVLSIEHAPAGDIPRSLVLGLFRDGACGSGQDHSCDGQRTLSQSYCQLAVRCVNLMVNKKGLYTSVFLMLPLVGARVLGAITQSDVSCKMVAVTVSAKNDAFMSFVDNAKANLANYDDLKSRAEAILAD
ncbi:hypothetical protein [Parasitella parasitica]|uniref:Secreted protein n=1 Tax=Parasitella parasitica TaxID=35722 RepID=A0A0B7NG93_9FUNG|nr:hypothetical protein [Parasitella parasitica]